MQHQSLRKKFSPIRMIKLQKLKQQDIHKGETVLGLFIDSVKVFFASSSCASEAFFCYGQGQHNMAKITLVGKDTVSAGLYLSFFLLLWCFDPGWMPGAHQSLCITPVLSWTGERKI